MDFLVTEQGRTSPEELCSGITLCYQMEMKLYGHNTSLGNPAHLTKQILPHLASCQLIAAASKDSPGRQEPDTLLLPPC